MSTFLLILLPSSPVLLIRCGYKVSIVVTLMKLINWISIFIVSNLVEQTTVAVVMSSFFKKMKLLYIVAVGVLWILTLSRVRKIIKPFNVISDECNKYALMTPSPAALSQCILKGKLAFDFELIKIIFQNISLLVRRLCRVGYHFTPS